MADVPVDRAFVLVLSKLAVLPLGPRKQELKRVLIKEAVSKVLVRARSARLASRI
jgi:hypothetical protein